MTTLTMNDDKLYSIIDLQNIKIGDIIYDSRNNTTDIVLSVNINCKTIPDIYGQKSSYKFFYNDIEYKFSLLYYDTTIMFNQSCMKQQRKQQELMSKWIQLMGLRISK